MRRNFVSLIAFAAVAVVAGVAQAQTYNPVIVTTGPSNVPGVTIGNSATGTNEATLYAYAQIASKLEFDVSDPNILCGIISPSAAGTCADDANITVRSNAPWAITMTDDALSAGNKVVTLDHDDAALTPPNNRSGAFQFSLAATTSTNADATTAQNPTASEAVSIKGTWTVDSATSATAVDPTDEYGFYQGSFTVVLFEQN